jgi:hypothetical protein
MKKSSSRKSISPTPSARSTECLAAARYVILR